MAKQWTKEQAWEWYNKQPWIRGFCGLPANCVNYVAMWQKHKHDEVMKQVEYEFDLARKTGLNAVRAFLINFEVCLYEHDSFMSNLEDYISLADKYGIKVMLNIGNDCTVPKERFEPVQLGEQRVDWGYHGGVRYGPFTGYTSHGYMIQDEPDIQQKFYEMVDEIAARYAKDDRIQIWDVWNEISNSNRGDLSVPMMEKCFEIIRSHDPIQPLTADVFAYMPDTLEPCTNAQRRALELSDVITFHHYGSFQTMVRLIEKLKEDWGRPVINNEWLNRISHNNVEDIFPLFYLEEVGSYHWGLIQGFSQTYEPWPGYTREIEDPNYAGPHDLTKFQHDLYRFNGKPYVAREVEIIKQFSELADKRFEKRMAKNN